MGKIAFYNKTGTPGALGPPNKNVGSLIMSGEPRGDLKVSEAKRGVINDEEGTGGKLSLLSGGVEVEA